MIDDIRNIDFRDLGSATPAAKGFLLVIIVALILGGVYWFFIKDQQAQLERAEAQEATLKAEFEEKQQKAANLDAYREQLADMEELLESMLRQLPSKTEMDKLLVDVSQTALAAGIENQLFEPGAENLRDFYVEQPISIRMRGDYHQFGDFVAGVASLPRVVILTMHDIALQRPQQGAGDDRLTLEGTVKTYRYLDEDEQASNAAAQQGGVQ